MFTNRKKFKISGKTGSHRKSLIKSQIIELIRNGRIKTTPTKARVLKSSFDRVVTHAKKQTDASKRLVSSLLGNNERAVERLYEVIADKLQDRTSGYTRAIKTLPRKGDNSEQVYVMLMNTEVREKESKIKATLAKQTTPKKVVKNAKEVKPVEKKAVVKPTKIAEKQQQAKTRRNSM